MKSSDLKVVAIILSIALFFTIITSNAVSIASVVILAKGGTGAAVQTGTQAPQGGTTATTPGGTVSTPQGGTTQTTPDAGTQTTPGGTTSTTPGGTTSTTPDGTTQQGGTTQTTPDANKPADNAGNADASNDPILKDPLGAYQKAAKEINQKGAAGYTKKGWQSVEGALQLSKGGDSLANTLTGIINKFMTPESEAEEKVNAKGSDDAKNRMPPSDCDKKYVKSATAKKEGDLYIVTIVMNDQVNPSYQDADGLVKMSKEFLDINDVKKTVTEDATVSKVVKNLDGEINYKAYTITATMNSKGQFVDITHYGVGDIKADLSVAVFGDISASGALSFNAKYYNFQY